MTRQFNWLRGLATAALIGCSLPAMSGCAAFDLDDGPDESLYGVSTEYERSPVPEPLSSVERPG